MKKFIFIIAIFAFTVGCNDKKTNTNENLEEKDLAIDSESSVLYKSYGDKITAENAIGRDAMLEKFKALKTGDTLAVKFSSKVIEVCQKKGCWMNLDLGEAEVMVRFKDYAFFMPNDINGSNIIVAGKAYIEEMSIEDQKHYAEDAKRSESEIAAIIKPKQTWTFEASGVLIPEREEK